MSGLYWTVFDGGRLFQGRDFKKKGQPLQRPPSGYA
jgi:hypothetical protein